MAMEENFATLLEVVADTAAETTAIVQGERATTWAQLDDRGARLARRLADHGVVRGERVGIGLYNGREYLETLLAVMKLRGSLTLTFEVEGGDKPACVATVLARSYL